MLFTFSFEKYHIWCVFLKFVSVVYLCLNLANLRQLHRDSDQSNIEPLPEVDPSPLMKAFEENSQALEQSQNAGTSRVNFTNSVSNSKLIEHLGLKHNTNFVASTKELLLMILLQLLSIFKSFTNRFDIISTRWDAFIFKLC